MKPSCILACFIGISLLSNAGLSSMGQVVQNYHFGTVANDLQCSDITFNCPKDQPIPGITWQSNIPANVFDKNVYRFSNKGTKATELVVEFTSDRKVVMRKTLLLKPNDSREVVVNPSDHTAHFSVLEWHYVVAPDKTGALTLSDWQDVTGDPSGPAALQWRWNKIGDSDGCHIEYRDLKARAQTFWTGTIFVTPPTRDPAKPTSPDDTTPFQKTGGNADSISAFCAYVKAVKATDVTRK